MRISDDVVRKVRRSYDEPGHVRELTFSCYHRLPLLSKDRSRQWFVEALDLARRQLGFELWAYVIMPEHAHVLVFPLRPDCRVSRFLKTVKMSVSRKAMRYLKANAPEWLDRLKVTWPDGRVEHRFWQQGGGYDRNISKVRTAWDSVAYIHNNPVRRGLVARPEDWEWSSARWYAGEQDVKLVMDGCPPQ